MITNVQIANIISENLSTPVNKDEIDKIANIICDKIEEDEKKLVTENVDDVYNKEALLHWMEIKGVIN